MPRLKDVNVHVALPLATATAEQLPMLLPPSVKLTVPVGDWPATVAVNTTVSPNADGLSELEKPTVVGFLLTV